MSNNPRKLFSRVSLKRSAHPSNNHTPSFHLPHPFPLSSSAFHNSSLPFKLSLFDPSSPFISPPSSLPLPISFAHNHRPNLNRIPSSLIPISPFLDSHNHHPSSSSSRSASSNLHLSQLNSINLYSNHLILSPYKSDSSSKLLWPKKSFYVFKNAASGIPKSSSAHALLSTSPSSSSPSILPNSDDYKPWNKYTFPPPQTSSSVQIGQDSYFLRPDSLGVADGVGGWSGKPGANPGLFSSKLMHHCSSELSRYEDTNDVKSLSYNQIDPVDILQYAADRSIYESKNEGILGSSTALIAVLRNDELRIANMGDCCCSIIRGNDYIFRTEEQQHSFNYPVQIGTNSKSLPTKDAQRYHVKVQKDDVVILSSDGLVDNLFDEDILEEVLKFTHDQKSESKPELISKSLCLKAKAVIEDQHAITSPFAQRASEEGIHYVGGKNDDISVLVAIVGVLE